MCVWSVLAGFTTESHFSTQLAPQQISSFLGASAEVQECACGLCLYFKKLGVGGRTRNNYQ
jgi:hypothetical protein